MMSRKESAAELFQLAKKIPKKPEKVFIEPDIKIKNLDELKEKYPAAVGIIERKAKQLMNNYEKHPFSDSERKVFLHEIKDYLIFKKDLCKDDDNNSEIITLNRLHEIYKKYLHIEDTKRIDAVLAVAASQKIKDGISLWLIVVGASGDMKSLQILSLDDGLSTYRLHNLTSKTLVNGYKDKKKYPDLAPVLHNKIVLIPDMSQILKLPPNEKGELWGQLRDLYDGYAGKHSGMGSSQQYEGLKVTLIAGSTPAIDAQILVHQDLGTRELIYRTEGNKEKDELIAKVFVNEECDEKIKQELKIATTNFLKNVRIHRKEIPQNILDLIRDISKYIAIMRATAEFDNYTNELRNFVYPEEPTRIAKQLKRVYVCLKSLDKNYADKTALQILWHIAQSSAFPVRVRVFELFEQNADKEMSTSQIAEKLCIGKGTAKRELSVLEALHILKCRREPVSTYTERCYEYWKLAKASELIEYMYILNIPIKILKFNTDNIHMYNISADAIKANLSIKPLVLDNAIKINPQKANPICPNCSSPDIHHYEDNSVCFSCKHKWVTE